MPPYSLGLIGYPLQHSLSPILHAAALHHLGLAGEYVCYPLPDLTSGETTLIDLLKGMREGTIQGLNVTIPHKKAVIPYLDRLTSVAQNIGAVNTIYLMNERLMGENTDASGFMRDLMNQNWYSPDPVHHKALILGSGGSARAVVFALLTAGWEVTIAARRIEQADALAASFPQFSEPDKDALTKIHTAYLNTSLIDQKSPPDLIINTTPVGMTPDIHSNPWPAGLPLPSSAAVYDLVYNPPETQLMRMAVSAGLPAVNGLGMLVEQAILSFEIWTGHHVPGTLLHQAAANHFLTANS